MVLAAAISTLALAAAGALETGPAWNEPITPIPAAPDANPLRLRIGRALFSDPRLSRSGTVSCASCHDLSTNGAAGAHPPTVIQQNGVPIDPPTVFNAALSFRLNREGDLRTLEDQVVAAVGGPEIRGGSVGETVARLSADEATRMAFMAAYGREPDPQAVLDAIATFERSLLTPDSRFDQWLRGKGSLSPLELDGYRTFKAVGCVSCHQGVNVGGNLFAIHGVFQPFGNATVHRMRVSSLRNVAATPPYFHDGSAPSLADAVQTMAAAQLGRTLQPGQVAAIVAFLGTLTGKYGGADVTAPQ